MIMTPGAPSESFSSRARSQPWVVVVVMLLLSLLAFVPRSIRVHQAPFRLDELVAIDQFLRQPLEHTLTAFEIGANHPLYNLLARTTTRYAMGRWNVRLPAFVAGVVAVPMLFWWL